MSPFKLAFAISFGFAIHSEGNAFFKRGQFENAIAKYRQATDVDPSEPAYWSNMAACYEKLGNYEEMANASQNCIKADKSFVKGYFRLATAQKSMNDLASKFRLSIFFIMCR